MENHPSAEGKCKNVQIKSIVPNAECLKGKSRSAELNNFEQRMHGSCQIRFFPLEPSF